MEVSERKLREVFLPPWIAADKGRCTGSDGYLSRHGWRGCSQLGETFNKNSEEEMDLKVLCLVKVAELVQ